MNTQSGWIRGSLIVGLIVGLLIVPEAIAGGKRGGHSGGGVRRPPRMSAAHRSNRTPSYRAPQMARARASARANTNVAQANNARQPVNSAQSRSNNTRPLVNGAPLTATTGTSLTNLSPNSYRYGSGNNTRRYQPHGYGRGYRNNYSANRSGYGQTQGNVRSVVSRLRSVHGGLAHLDHDYQGHRVRAMHQISMAIRRLSHRSTGSSSNGFSNVGNNLVGAGTNTRRTGTNGIAGANGRNGLNGVNGQNRNAGANGRGNQRLTQAQSDARMSQALRTTQGIVMQMSHQGTNSTGHSRAQGHLHRAMHEMNVALAVR